MTEAEIEQVRQFCRAILRAFPGSKITVRESHPTPTKGERPKAAA